MQLHAWLDDVRSNPYAEQLSRGFRRLRFASALESEYRSYLLKTISNSSAARWASPCSPGWPWLASISC